jgi:hypothetical protein
MIRHSALKPFSYLIAAVIGCVLGWGWKHREAVPSEKTATVDPAEAKGITTRPDGTKLLEDFVQQIDGKRKEPVGLSKGVNQALPVSTDPAGDFKKLHDKYAQDLNNVREVGDVAPLADLLRQWMEVDPKAALMAVFTPLEDFLPIPPEMFAKRVTEEYLKVHGISALVDALADTPVLARAMSSIVLTDVGSRGSLQELQLLRERAPVCFEGDRAGRDLGKEWPLERRDELLAALDAKSTAAAAGAMMERMDGSSGGEWLLGKLKNGEFSKEITDAMASGSLGTYYSNLKGVTLVQRLEIMDELGTLQKTGADRAKNEMIFNSIMGAFHGYGSDSDMLFSLRHGVMTAQEVAEQVAQETPDPGKHRGEYNSQMFRTLAEENLPAAMELLAGMSAADQEKQKAYAARWWFRNVDPDDFYKLTDGLVRSDDASVRGMMQDAWNDKARGNLQRFGPAYLEWIKSLPDGENKTLALRSVQNVGGASHARLAAEAGNLLKQKP